MSDILIGVVIGGALTLVGTVGVELVRGKFESKLDREKRADDRRIERDRFQRATLEAAQEAVRAHMTVVGRIHTIYAVAERETGKWGMRLDPELDQSEQATRQQVSLLRSKIDDEALRAQLERLLQVTGGVWLGREADAGRAAFIECAELTSDIFDRSGTLIRATFTKD